MQILKRQYLVEFLKGFALIALGLTALMTVISSFSGASKFAGAEVSSWTIISYSLLGIPNNLSHVLPVAALVAALLSVGKASGSRELVAITAAGGRLRATLAPLIVIGALLSLLGFSVTEVAMPYSERKAEGMLNKAKGKKFSFNMADGSTWMRTKEGDIARFGFFSRAEDAYGDVGIFHSENGELKKITRAKKAKHLGQDKGWRLEGISTHNFMAGETGRQKELLYNGLPEPSELSGSFNYSARMSVFELMRHLKRLRAAGFRNPEIDIEIHSRMAAPMIILVMVLLGTAIASRRSVGAIMAATIGISVTALYWLMVSVAGAMGLAGMLPPPLAGWLVPLALTAASAWMYNTIPE